MPQMGVSVAEGTVVAWRVEVGDRIDADQTIAEISTDKIDTEVPAPASGVVAEILVPVESTVSVGTVMARIAVGDGASSPPATPGPAPVESAAPEHPAASPAAPEPEPAPTAAPPSPAGNWQPGGGNGRAAGNRRYSPVVQRIASEHGIDLSRVEGTGRGGRVRKQDVLAFVESAPAVEEPPLHIESPYRPEPEPATGQRVGHRARVDPPA